MKERKETPKGMPLYVVFQNADAEKTKSPWHTHRYLDGRRQKHKDAGASTARHLYNGTVWHGVMYGMTNETEQKILDALNRNEGL